MALENPLSSYSHSTASDNKFTYKHMDHNDGLKAHDIHWSYQSPQHHDTASWQSHEMDFWKLL